MSLPKHIADWLAVNDDVPAKRLKCPLCGGWFALIDHLAPYHWEMCYCAKCGVHPISPDDELSREGAKATKAVNP